MEDPSTIIRELIGIAKTIDDFASGPIPWGGCRCDHGCDGRAPLRGDKCGRCKALERLREIEAETADSEQWIDPAPGHPELTLDHATPAYCPPRYVHGVCGNNPCTCDQSEAKTDKAPMDPTKWLPSLPGGFGRWELRGHGFETDCSQFPGMVAMPIGDIGSDDAWCAYYEAVE